MFRWDFGGSNITQIENTCPALDSSGHHSFLDHIVGEKINCGHQCLKCHFSINHASDVDDYDRSLIFVAFVAIDDATVQVLEEWLNVCKIGSLAPLRVLQNLIIRLLVIPFETLQEAKNGARFIIVASWKSETFNLKEISEVI